MAIDIDKAMKSLRKRRYGGVDGFDADGNVTDELKARMSLLSRDRDPEGEKCASARDNLHLGLLGLGTVGALSSAHSAHRAATTREKEYKQKYEKTAMWDGFDKEATVFNIKHGKELSAVTQKLRNLMNKKAGIFDAIGRLAKTEHKVVHELGPESLAAIHRMAEGVGKKSKPMEILKSGLLGAGGLAAGTAIGGALGSRLGRRVAPAKPDT